MRFRRALTLAIAATWSVGALAGSAGARDSADDYVPYQPSGFFVFDWSGFYAGGQLGLAHTLAESSEVLFPDNPQLFESFTLGQSETSVTGGVQAGWQRQWGRMVAGVELGFSLLRFDTTTQAQQIFGLEGELVAGLTRSAQVSNILLLTGRLGYTDGRWLAYAKGGVANADVDVSFHDAVTGAATSSSGRETGWTAGVGIDYALTYNLFLGVEYNYVHFRADVMPPPIPQAEFSNVDVDIQNVVVRLNYRFGSPCCIPPAGPNGP